MAQAGYTTIQLYRSATASAVPNPANLTAGELALNYNTADMALYAKNSGGGLRMLINNPDGLVYPTVDGISGQVMFTDGTGSLSLDSNIYVGGDSVLITTGAGGAYSTTFGDGANYDNIYTVGPSGHHGLFVNTTEVVRINSSGTFVYGQLGIGYASVTGTNTLATAGMLGVGTSAPAYTADIRGATGSGIAYYDATVRNYLGTTGSNTGVIGTLTNHRVAFYSNNTERMQLTAAGTLSLTGSSAVAAMVTPNIFEPATIVSSAISGTPTIAFYLTTQSVMYYNAAAQSSNWAVNFRASSGTTLDSAMTTGQAVTAVMLVNQGASAFYNSQVQVDGIARTVKWQNGLSPVIGDANAIDVYTYTIIKTASATFTVLASITKFA